jgi:hypothetical protein
VCSQVSRLENGLGQSSRDYWSLVGQAPVRIDGKVVSLQTVESVRRSGDIAKRPGIEAGQPGDNSS